MNKKPLPIKQKDTTDYLLGGSLVMKNGKIDKVLFDGGYAQASVATKTTDKFAFNFYNQDHLGNNREVVDAKGAVQQVTNYYPFGAPYADAAGGKYPDLQSYKYNGKELDLMHGLNTYDYGARQHDPILCRWDRIDPLCEKYYETSPYVYCLDNPVKHIDPDGRSVWKVGIKAVYKVTKSVAKNGAKSLNKASTYADAFDDVIKDGSTLLNPNASAMSKVEAGVSLLSEIFSPLSVNDVKAIKATKNNYRRVLQKVTGKTGKGYEAHHSLPQKHRKKFEEMGINIDEPGNVVWREAKGHQKKSNALTKEWNNFMKDSHTKEDVYKKRDELERKYFGNKSDIPNK